MNRGRLAIFSPDGPIENFMIEQETIAIGRSTGNDLTLDKQGISRYHASITVRDAVAELRDLESVNGTYVDGLRLDSEQPRILRGGEEVQMGDIRLIFYPAQPSIEDTVVGRLESTQSDYLNVKLEGPDIAVTPGTHAPATLKLVNTSDETLRLSLQIEGLPVGWARLDRLEAELTPGRETEIDITFKPARRAETTPGTYNFLVRIADVNGQAPPIEINSQLEILQYNGYGVVLGEPIVALNEPFKIYIHNQGNGTLPLRFFGADKEQILTYQLQPEQVTLSAGERLIVNGVVKARQRPFIGKPMLYEFNVISQSQSVSRFIAPVGGKVHISPRLSRQILTIILVVPILVVLGLGLVALEGLLRGGDADNAAEQLPSIQQFQIDGESNVYVTNNVSPMLLEWSTADADWVTMAYQNDAGVSTQYPLPAGENQQYILYLPEIGTYDVQLIAENAQNQSSVENIQVIVGPTATISAQISMDSEESTSLTIYRNVGQQNMLIEWEFEQSLLTSFENMQLNIIGSDGVLINESINLSIEDGQYRLPIEAPETVAELGYVTVEILAAGTQIQSMIVPIVYPKCNVMGTLPVYSDGAAGATILFEALPGELLQLSGRNSAGWARVILPSQDFSVGFWGWLSPETIAPDAQCDVNFDQLGIIGN